MKAAIKHRILCMIWPHLPVVVIAALYKYHRAHLVMIQR